MPAHKKGVAKNHAWTPQEDAALVSMKNAGMDYTSIGRQLGRSKDASRGRYCTLMSPTNIAARENRSSLASLPDRPAIPIDDSGHVAKIRALGCFRGLEFKPGRVFAYVNRRPYQVHLND